MLNKKEIKKIVSGLALCGGMMLFSAMSQGAIIASFESEASVTVTTDLAFDFDKALVDEGEDSTGTGVTSIFGDLDVNSGILSALASGTVDEGGGLADAFNITEGLITIKNTTNTNIVGTITFDLALIVNILADAVSDYAIGLAGMFFEQTLYDANGNIIQIISFFDDFVELELDAPDPGDSLNRRTDVQEIVNVVLAPGQILEFYIEADASGIAESSRIPVNNVSAPNVAFAMFGSLLVMIAWRKQVKK